MNPTDYERAAAIVRQGLPAVRCVLIDTRGSTPQKAGAGMFVYGDGSQTGTLGGGCVEAEVRRRALAGMNGRPEVHTFLLDNDYGWDDGLICGGRMSVLTLPLTCNDATHLEELAGHLRAGHGGTEILSLDAVARWDGTHVVPQAVVRQNVAFLPTAPRKCIWIVGAGHVGEAVARYAADLDFDVWVFDDRASCASAERFPHVARRIVEPIGEGLTRHLPEITEHVYGLIVTRGHNHDEEALHLLAPTCAGYVGMIGSRRKINLIFEDLLAKGLPEESLKRVHAPVGLPIGGRSVPEIAVSIIAQLVSVRNGVTRRGETSASNDSPSVPPHSAPPD